MSISFPGAGASATPTASPTKSALTAKPAEAKTAEQKFLEWAKMTPAERMHAQMLSQLGITEDQFKAMDPAAQQKIEEKIRDMIKKQAEDSNDKRTGLITDKTA
jgi:TPP-dependent pyruvate/acetoin dehydrogenase alpha subunit